MIYIFEINEVSTITVQAKGNNTIAMVAWTSHNACHLSSPIQKFFERYRPIKRVHVVEKLFPYFLSYNKKRRI
jgi:hypothetical protein